MIRAIVLQVDDEMVEAAEAREILRNAPALAGVDQSGRCIEAEVAQHRGCQHRLVLAIAEAPLADLREGVGHVGVLPHETAQVADVSLDPAQGGNGGLIRRQAFRPDFLAYRPDLFRQRLSGVVD